jgi:hypothetical protein
MTRKIKSSQRIVWVIITIIVIGSMVLPLLAGTSIFQ